MFRHCYYRETKGAVGKAAAMAAKKNQARLGKKASNQGGRPIKTPVQVCLTQLE